MQRLLNNATWILSAAGGLILTLSAVCFAHGPLAVAGASLLVIAIWKLAADNERFRQLAHAAAQRVVPSLRPEPDDPDDLVEAMLQQGRFALLLRPQIAENLTPAQRRQVIEEMDRSAALVPEGWVVLRQPPEVTDEDDVDEEQQYPGRKLYVEPLMLDRYQVTNLQYQEFVSAGGYQQMALWDPEIWPGVLEFVDMTGEPGPRFWRNGTFARDLDNHPVVGVCWYEAMAYARWVGKRLPTDAEWVKAAAWPVPVPGGAPIARKFPWGSTMDFSRANLWGAQIGGTCEVNKHTEGVSVGGVYGMIGNTWEWTASAYGAWHGDRHHFENASSLKSLRGGAFDTYFDNQACCQFQSGDSPLARKHNIGIRCAVGLCDLAIDETAVVEAAPTEEPTDLGVTAGQSL